MLTPDTIHHIDAIEGLGQLPDESVDCVVTSPPYWGLRSYGTPPQIWNGDDECEHEWGGDIRVLATNHVDKRRWQHTRNGRDEEQPLEKRVGWKRHSIGQGAWCQVCGAWRGELGLEPTPQLYVEHLVWVFREVRRALKPEGTLWLIMGDCYSTGAGRVGKWPGGGEQGCRWLQVGPITQPNRLPLPGLKPKDLVGTPWMVAFALRNDGWHLRSDIIWSKPNPMPESVKDRPTRSHEYVFLLSRQRRYFYNPGAIAEPLADASLMRTSQLSFDQQPGGPKDDCENSSRSARKALMRVKHPASGNRARKREPYRLSAVGSSIPWEGKTGSRNARTVWTMSVRPSRGPHFATFPPDLVRRCILAGSRPGDIVLDPFMGSGTTAVVAKKFGRHFIGFELNPEYVKMAQARVESCIEAEVMGR